MQVIAEDHQGRGPAVAGNTQGDDAPATAARQPTSRSGSQSHDLASAVSLAAKRPALVSSFSNSRGRQWRLATRATSALCRELEGF